MISSVKIGPFNYPVSIVENLHDFDGNQKVPLWGHIKHSALSIELSDILCEDRSIQVLWHEILHGVLNQASQDQPEEIIDALATGIVQILRDNLDLIELTVGKNEKNALNWVPKSDAEIRIGSAFPPNEDQSDHFEKDLDGDYQFRNLNGKEPRTFA